MSSGLPSHRPVWCLVTGGAERRRAGVTDRDVLARIAALARAGLDLLQVREPQREARDSCAFVRACRGAVTGTSTRVLVNDRIDVALATGVDGVHLRGDGPPASRVRGLGPPGWLIGRSVHDRAEAEQAWRDGELDYLVAGTVFPTPSKPSLERHLGLEGLQSIASGVGLPVLGIGGLTLPDVGAVLGTGAAGIAGIGLFLAPDLDALIKTLAAPREGPSVGGEGDDSLPIK